MAPVGDCLRRPKGRLAQLVAQTDRLAHINRVFRAYLPNHLRDHVKIVGLTPQYWLVQTDSSAWASKLRYMLPDLQQQLGSQFGAAVQPLKLRVQPLERKPDEPQPQRRMTMNRQSAELLAGAAEGISDQRLGAALLRLAGNAGRQEKPLPPTGRSS